MDWGLMILPLAGATRAAGARVEHVEVVHVVDAVLALHHCVLGRGIRYDETQWTLAGAGMRRCKGSL